MTFKLSFVLFELAWTAVFILAFRHSLTRWGTERSVRFLAPAITFGWLLEWGFQTFFHGYRYGEGFLLYAANVPLSVALTWAALAYIAFWAVTVKLRMRQPLAAVTLAALLMVAVDALFFEPMAHTFGFWTWTNPGPWFGAQNDNFVLWFLTPALHLTAFWKIDETTWPAWKKQTVALALVPLQFVTLVFLLQAYFAIAAGR